MIVIIDQDQRLQVKYTNFLCHDNVFIGQL